MSSKNLPPVESHTGIVALLDSLGTRTGTLDQAVSYVRSLEELKRDIEGSLKVYLKDHPKETLVFYDQLKIRFFGDSVLLTYEVQQNEALYVYIEYLFAVLGFLYIAAFELGILFRGAISIGEFIERENVVLGPAINDAATWYDRFDVIGTAATPAATQRIRNSYYQRAGDSREPWSSKVNLMLYDMPLTGGGTERLFAANWPCKLGYKERTTPEKIDWLRDYFALIARFPVPLGTESKFTNTGVFVQKSIDQWEDLAKEAMRAAIADGKLSSTEHHS